MSDRELVTLDTGQFNGLSQKLDNLAARLGPPDEQYSLHQVLTHLETTLNRLATTMSGGDNTQVLTAINNLSRKVDEFMATQEERLQAIATKIDEVLSDLATLKTNNPQIEDEISAIESKLSIAQPTGEPQG